MLEPGRNYSVANTNYRYGFNGKENDNDIENGMQDYGMRIYDGRLGKFLSVDPITKKYPMLTPYQFASNSPISGIDLDGLEYYFSSNGLFLGHIGKSQEVWTADKVDSKIIKNADGSSKTIDIPVNPQNLNVMYPDFIKSSSIVYGESSHTSDKEANSIAAIYISGRNKLSYAVKRHLAVSFRNTNDEARNVNSPTGRAMQQAIKSVIDYHNGIDYSNGADAWDGEDQAIFNGSDDRFSTGKYELHMNTEGWKISDKDFNSWKAAIGKRFKAPQIKYAPGNYKGYKNAGKISLISTAQYGKSIFWKVLEGNHRLSKPKLKREGLPWIILLFISFLFGECTNAQIKTKKDSVLVVERWEKEENGDTVVFEKKRFESNNLTSFVRYHYGISCPFLDSSTYQYSNENLIESIRYISEYCDKDSICGYKCYSCAGDNPSVHVCIKEDEKKRYFYNNSSGEVKVDDAVVDQFGFMRHSTYYLKHNERPSEIFSTSDCFDINDTLGILNSYISQINFACGSKSKIIAAIKNTSVINKRLFVTNQWVKIFILEHYELFSQYSLDQAVFLKSVAIYLKGNKLIKDQFFFRGIIVSREYKYYTNGLPKEVLIKIINSKQKTQTYTEGFRYLILLK